MLLGFFHLLFLPFTLVLQHSLFRHSLRQGAGDDIPVEALRQVLALEDDMEGDVLVIATLDKPCGTYGKSDSSFGVMMKVWGTAALRFFPL